ncbi:hypothetical protein [Devosia sp. DBB001]|nr:hypothetical protein [Devosia sp. DBB001]
MSRVLSTLGEAAHAKLEMIAVCHKVECRHRQKIDLYEVMKYVGAGHKLVPDRGLVHFSERMRCPECKTKGMFVWMEIPLEQLPLYPGDRNAYRVLDWGLTEGRLEREVASIHNLEIARAAYDAAVKVYPTHHLTLQQGALLMKDNWEDRRKES